MKAVYSKRSTLCIVLLTVTVCMLVAVNLLIGSVHIPPASVVDILLHRPVPDQTWEFILWESRVPQCVTALLCGASLAVSGLMLQTVFCNPLADTSVLGISAGAGLGAAVVLLVCGGGIAAPFLWMGRDIPVVAGAFCGAALVAGLLLLFSSIIQNSVMFLIVGIMIGYLASSVISLLTFFSTAEGVQSYVLWGMGNFSGVTLGRLPLFSALVGCGLLVSVLLVKPLNALLLGYRYAENLGVNVRRIRNMLLLATGLLTAVTTAYCGPITFIGLAVPHVARMMLGTSSHHRLMPVTLLAGSAVSLLCNVLCILPGQAGVIPLNAVTPVLGAPVVIYVILNRNRLHYFNG